MKIFLVAITCLFSLSCVNCTKSRKADVTVVELDAMTINARFKMLDPKFTSVFDYTFHNPTNDVWKEINDAWESRPNKREYVAQFNDCDDYAQRYIRFTKDYAFDKYGINLPVFFFGFFWEEKGKHYGHAIVIRYRGDVFDFYDPTVDRYASVNLGKIFNITIQQ